MNKIIIAVSSLAMILMTTVSCSKDVIEEKNSAFSLSKNSFSIGAEGGPIELSYTMESPVYDGTFNFRNMPSWISADASVSGVISFEVSPNTGEEEREATVNVSYSGAVGTSDVHISQAGYVEPPFFDFNITDITYTEVVFDVKPADKMLTYVALTVEKETFDSFGSDEAYFQDDLAFFRQEAAVYGLTLTEFLSQSLLKGDVMARRVDRLLPGETYYIYAYALTADGERTSDIYKTEFSTDNITKVSMSFDISCSINGPYADLTIVPDNPSQAYVYGVYDQSGINSPEDILRNHQSYIYDCIDEGEVNGLTVAQVLEEIAATGEIERHYKLQTSSGYVAFAAAVNNSGLIISDPVIREFRTEDRIHPSDNQIVISVTDIGGRSAGYSVTVTNDDPYVLFCLKDESVPDMTDDELLDYFTGDFDLSSLAGIGNDQGTITHLSPDTDYTLFAFGYLGGEATTELVRSGFRTGTAVMSDVTISVEHDKYFDGTEAAMKHDAYYNAVGLLVFPVEISYTGDVKHCYYQIYEGDLTDGDTYPYEEVISHLMDDSYYSMATDFFLEYDKVYTIAAVAEDEEGDLGPLYREKIGPLSKDGVSPIDELFYAESSVSASDMAAPLRYHGIKTVAFEDMTPEVYH